jgi:hypothetical protein
MEGRAAQRFRNQVGKHLPDAMKTGRMACMTGRGEIRDEGFRLEEGK